jgi:hypothetical protein
MRLLACVLVLSSSLLVSDAFAQTPAAPAAPDPPKAAPAPAPEKLTVGSVDVSVFWRARVELWDWFESPVGDGGYGYFNSTARVGFGQTKKAWDWRLELSAPVYLGAPDDASGPPPLGAYGFGPGYYGSNGRNTSYGQFFLKQAFVQFKGLGKSTLKVGRFEFFDGTEAKIPDPALNALVQSRIAHRLISNSGFPAAQRSYDGAILTWSSGPNTVAGFGARTTAGGVHLNGWTELDIEVYYGAYNRLVKTANGTGIFRVFGVGYVDHRNTLSKPDNRPAPVKVADNDSIALFTYGADYAHVFKTASAGTFDVIGYLAGQTGSWGTLSQSASTAFGEFGWQPKEPVLKPWLRVGYRYSSGDDDPLDGDNGTFYQVMGATRQYAKFPYYNMMNLKDVYGLFAVRPSPKYTVRGEIHGLSLADSADLWYSGGGPWQSDAFGYSGRPSHGSDSLGTLWDVALDVPRITPHLGVNFYYGHASAGSVITGTYPDGGSGNFGYIESVVRF